MAASACADLVAKSVGSGTELWQPHPKPIKPKRGGVKNDEEQERMVFDGLLVHFAGGKRGADFNQRFGQPSASLRNGRDATISWLARASVAILSPNTRGRTQQSPHAVSTSERGGVVSRRCESAMLYER